jgi:hypothetical protein
MPVRKGKKGMTRLKQPPNSQEFLKISRLPRRENCGTGAHQGEKTSAAHFADLSPIANNYNC